jgi:glycosyltransferase involved in cell wall biosynthesis
MKALLLSAYAAHSHVHWQNCLQSMFPQWHWQVLSLPPRHFSWRVRGNPLFWSQAERATLEQDYDWLIVTSMVDLATLRGLVPALSKIPTVVYFHENQFAYPQHKQQHNLLEAQMVSLYSGLAADYMLFNSNYNRETFLVGCAALLDKLPDFVPAGVIGLLQDKAGVLPVPYDGGDDDTGDDSSDGSVQSNSPDTERHLEARALRISWLGRFEHDKGGEGLLRILQRLELESLDYELTVTGQQFRQSPAVFAEIQSTFGHRLIQFGYVEERLDYRVLLQSADIVLSTALHEFQGLAILEAAACGCLPVVPNRLVYPEIFPPRYCYTSSPLDPDGEAQAATSLILKLAGQIQQGTAGPAPDISAFSWRALRPRYTAFFGLR